MKKEIYFAITGIFVLTNYFQNFASREFGYFSSYQNGPHISLTVTIYLFGLNQLVLVCASYIAQWEICTFLYVMKVSFFCNLAGIMQSSVSVVCPWQ